MSSPATPDYQSLDQITKATGLGAFVIGGASQGGGTQWGQNVDGSNVSAMTMGGLTNILSGGIADIPAAIEKVAELLLTLPLEVLQAMQQIIPGAIPEQFIDVATAVTTIMSSIATPVFTLFDTFMQFVQTILNALTGGLLTGDLATFVDQFPVIGQLFQGFTDLTGLLGNPTGLGTGSPSIPGLGSIPLLGGLLSGGLLDPSLLGDLPTEVQQMLEIAQGLVVTPINTAVQFFKDWFTGLFSFGFDSTSGTTVPLVDASKLTDVGNGLVPANVMQGFQGVVDMINTFQSLFDGMGTATSGTTQSGLSFSGLFSFLQDLAFNADAGGSQGAINTNILGIRINKSVGAGANPTSEAMHPIGLFGSNGTMTTTSVPAGTAIAQTFRASEVAKKGFFEFVASAPAGTTNIFTNVFSVDPSTGAKTKLWGSNDISGLVPTSLNYVKSLIPGGSQPTVNAGQNLLLEIVNGSANALTVATRNTGQPTHPTDYPKNLGTTRTLASTGGNSPASLTDAQVTYTANHPYVNFGIANVPPGYVAPQLQQFPDNGTWTRPGGFVDGDYVDVFALGGGGGGQSGGYGLTGSGGQAGQWVTRSFVIGSDPKGTGLPILPNSTTTLAVVAGASGSMGTNPYTLDPGGNGGASTVSGAGITTISAAGGIGGGNGYTGSGTGGQGAGDRTIADYTAFGGPATGMNGGGGSVPGGGGPSGYPAFGGLGGRGKVWIRTRQA